ncbi:DUF2167 domain-containing protein [Parvularcula dongshanensis]|uniref:Putative membrane-anchored protein n=1 Tax=Parvularcula dongshanensis TaxID=1173995 RepID=A0A840I652_9PROT|nr:DUF2167 domain-containing protein [Parvularcula dongshanensis]MBB4660359.1 putative membrane-anchored protein [Parvularcula dongshanensis]
MIRKFAAVAALAALCAVAHAQDTETALADEAAPDARDAAWAEAFQDGLERRTGRIEIADGVAILEVPEDFYFLGPEDAAAVLEEAWGNPEDEAILGMIFPARFSPLDRESWGVSLSYDRDGYVSDDDASSIDYDELLQQMQDGAEAQNAWRQENGYGAVHLLGWAESPSYDPSTSKMFWAKQLRFEGTDVDTLNYNVRALGREGVLNANFIATMGDLAEIKEASPAVMEMISFSAGNRYADYQEGDKVAAYGIAGMVAGGALLAKKSGLIAVALIALKKFGILALAGIGAMFGAVKRLFSKEF